MSVSEPLAAPTPTPRPAALAPRPNAPLALIVNPRSAHGRTAKRWPQIERRIRAQIAECAVFHTERQHHATELTRAALHEGYERIISVGGDGTHFEVMNGFFEDEAAINPHAVFGILNHGTGGDLARTLHIPRGDAGIALLAGGQVIASDVARITYEAREGGRGACYFLNSCHIGIGGDVVERVNSNSKAAGGFFSFAWATLLTLFEYRDKSMRLEVDGLTMEQTVKEFICTIGEYDGGGMHVAPNAKIDDGLFEVYVVGRVSVWDAIASLHLVYRGQMTKRPDLVKYFRARRCRVQCDERVRISVDGEMPGYVPADIELLHRALNVITGW